MAKKKTKRIKFPKIFHVHAVVTGLFLLAYVVFSSIYAPEFLLSDMRAKFQAVADEVVQISAHVLGPPQKPIVSASAVCSNGTLSINLDWADDENSEYFDINRDALPLVTGITDSDYTDEAAAVDTTYNYIVTAHGWMNPGFAVSDPVSVTTPTECSVVLPAPFIRLIAVGGGIEDNNGNWITNERQPVFSGNSNIANAAVSIVVSGDINYAAQTATNVNGYWSWQPPAELAYGKHTFFVSVTEPNNPLRKADTSAVVMISEQKNDNDSTEKKKAKKKSIAPTQGQPQTAPAKEPDSAETEVEMPSIALAYSLVVDPAAVIQGKSVAAISKIESLDGRFEGREAIIRYSLIDKGGKLKLQDYESVILKNNARFAHDFKIDKNILTGGYVFRAEIIFSDYDIVREAPLEISDLPVLNLGGGVIISYQELLSDLGTASIWLLIALLIWLGILSREYWLSAHALRQITEESLRSMGMIPVRGRKKGV